jgi:hypothetical protein
LYGPTGITIDSSGNLFITDNGGGTIRMIDTNDVVTTIAGQAFNFGSSDGTATNASFFLPTGITIDSNNSLFVVSLNSALDIRKIDTNDVVTTITNKYAGLIQPREIAVDPSGNFYVAGQSSSNIYKVAPGGAFIPLKGTFTNVGGLVTDPSGNLIIAQPGVISVATAVVPSLKQTIKFPAIPAKVFGEGTFSLSATASSSLPVSFTSSNTNVATVDSSNTVTIIGAGVTTIMASQIGGRNSSSIYAAAPPVSHVLVVGKASQSITFSTIPAQTFGAGTVTLSASAPSLSTVIFTSSNKKVATISGSALTIVGGGITTITAAVPASANYKAATTHQTLQVAKATQSISFTTPSTESFVKGGTFALSGSAQGGTVTFKSSNPKVISIVGNTATMKAAGNATITATQGGNANYQAATPIAISVSVQ